MLLLAKATSEQGNTISNVLEEFEVSSGLRVNQQKSYVIFSRNVDHNMRSLITGKLDFGQATSLSTYPSFPIQRIR